MVFTDEIGEDLKGTLHRGLEFINWDRYIDKGSKVFVKPNFTYPFYKEGVTTNPELLKCLLELLKSKTDTVMLGESDGGNNTWKPEQAFEGHNMYEICNEAGVELVNLSSLPSETIKDTILGRNVEVIIPKMLLEEIDCFISVPVLKVHAMTILSLSLKNLWGCDPDTMRVLRHQNLDYKLALMAKLLKPKIVVIDGTYALNKHGPLDGEPVKLGLISVADNPVSADKLGAEIMGFSPDHIKHIVVAERAGLVPENNEVQTNKRWQQYRRQFQMKRTFLDRLNYYLPFKNDVIAKLVFSSRFTSLIYKIVAILRTRREKKVASDIGTGHESTKGYF